jgi:succinate dehydrogenase / fumarate reductase cytochrome b subunit
MFRRLNQFARSSIGQKSLMSVTGLLLIGFLIAHVAGNLTLFADDTGEVFDSYAHKLRSNPLLPVAELGLAALFIAHIVLGVRTELANRTARPARYKELAPHGRRTWSSITMLVTGCLVLVFLIVHLFDFRLAVEEDQDLAPMVVARLSSPVGAAIYFVGVGALGIHLWHAFQSLFQTLGLVHPRYRPLIRKAGWGLAGVLAGLFWLFPTFCLLQPDRWRVGTETAREAPAESAAQAIETEEGH